jgi:excinuclease UvrABC ATPase subunit
LLQILTENAICGIEVVIAAASLFSSKQKHKMCDKCRGSAANGGLKRSMACVDLIRLEQSGRRSRGIHYYKTHNIAENKYRSMKNDKWDYRIAIRGEQRENDTMENRLIPVGTRESSLTDSARKNSTQPHDSETMFTTVTSCDDQDHKQCALSKRKRTSFDVITLQQIVSYDVRKNMPSSGRERSTLDAALVATTPTLVSSSPERTTQDKRDEPVQITG